MVNSWWVWLVVGMILGGGPLLWLKGRRLDKSYSSGWDAGVAKLKAGQLARLRGGAALILTDRGPRWHDPAVDPGGLTVPRLGGYFRSYTGEAWQPKPTDQLAINARYFETPAATSPAAGQDPALVFPPAGAGPEPPGPDGAESPSPGDAVPCEGGTVQGASGPGDLFALLPDAEAFEVIRWEFARLTRMVGQPYKLTGWRAA